MVAPRKGARPRSWQLAADLHRNRIAAGILGLLALGVLGAAL
jgi:hypothetical protein